MTNKCKECGCVCKQCIVSNDHDVHLHVEIENLKQKLLERENHIVTMETNFLNEANKFPNGELMALREELLLWQDKYRRLYDAHRRVQRVNQGLEDKLLKLVDTCESDKSTLTKDVAVLSQKLAEANYTIKKLTQDNERYKSDVSLAIQFLQCKQSNFVARKYDSLPIEVQNQISTYIKRKPDKPEVKSIKVPIPTFPPTAMVYSVPKTTIITQISDDSETQTMLQPQQQQQPSVDIVSAAIMAKVLEERQKEKAYAKHCDTCTCSKKLSIIYDIKHCTIGTQTNNDIKCCNQQQQSQNQEKNVAQVLPNNFLTDTICTETLEQNKSNLHHYLCSKIVLPYEKEKQSANCLNNDLKGPRYCSVKLETDTKNILLDNIHNNIAPVLYTRNHHHHHNHHQHHQKMKDTPKLHEQYSPRSFTESNNNNNLIDNDIENNQNNSQLDDNEEKKRLAQMEENVKRFLFGESGLLKTNKLVTLNGDDDGNCTN